MLEELRTVLDRLDHLLIKITPNIDDNIIIPQINIHNNNCDTTSKNGSVRNEDVHIGDDIDSSPSLSPITSNPLPSQFTPPTTTSSTIIISRPANFLDKHPSDINEIIECLRRSAEIVALSERRAGALEEETAALASSRLEERRRRRRKDRRRTRDVDSTDNDQRNESQSTTISVEHQKEELPQGNYSIHDDDIDDNNDDEVNVEEEEVDVAARLLPHHIAPFELFCERNVLSKIVGLVTGSTFDNPISPPPPHSLPPLQPHSGSRQQQQPLQSSSIPSPQPPPPPSPLLLPLLSIATQAVQSASILIQNVCRATSLYLLLSNNVVNDLIGLPLESYRQACEAEEADANEKDLASAAMTNTGRR